MAITVQSEALASLADSISRSVQSRTGGQIRHLTIEVAGPDVIISGQSSTYYVKQLATHAALDFAGQFTSLTNSIEVV